MDPQLLDQLNLPVIDVENYESTLRKSLKPELLRRLPKPLGEVLFLYYLEGKKQYEIAEHFNCTQGNICRALKKARYFLRWLHEAPEQPEGFYELLRKVKLSEGHAEVIKEYIEGTHAFSQSGTAYELGIMQSTVHQRIKNVLVRLQCRGCSKEFEYLRYFFEIPYGARNYFKWKISPNAGRPSSYYRFICGSYKPKLGVINRYTGEPNAKET